jgi:nucleotide-binding universal stress UspA family protein
MIKRRHRESTGWPDASATRARQACSRGALTIFQNIFAAAADTNAPIQVAATKAVGLARANAGSALLYHAAYESVLSGRPLFDTTRLARTRKDYLKRQVHSLDAIAEAPASPQVAVATEVEWERRWPEAVLKRFLREAKLRAKALLLRGGTPADVILQAFEKESVDILVPGSMAQGKRLDARDKDSNQGPA